MTIIIDDIVTLDTINMSPYFELEGMKFDKDKRKSGLLSEIDKGAQFATIIREGKIVAYFEYIPVSPENGKICSIQIHPYYQDKFILRRLFRNMYCLVKNIKEKTIISATHARNVKSIKFHKLGGFTISEENSKRIIFAINSEVFTSNLLKFIKGDIF